MAAVAMAVSALTALAGVGATDAGADAFGQLGIWGEPGNGNLTTETPNQLFASQGAFGVDPVSGDVYVLDSKTDFSEYRLQKFSSAGTFIASAKIPRPTIIEEGEEYKPFLIGIAIDHARHRVYLLQEREGADATKPAQIRAEKMLVFSTEPNATELHGLSGPGGPTELAFPGISGETTALQKAQAIVVDPLSGDLLVFATERGTGGWRTVSRFSVSGSPLVLAQTARFVESGTHILSEIAGMAVTSDGSKLYIATAENNVAPAKVFVLSTNLATATLSATPALTSPRRGGSAGSLKGKGGSGLALSADGEVLYVAEEDAFSSPSVNEIRGLSVSDGSTRVLYGGGTASCKITQTAPQLGAGPDGLLFGLDTAAAHILRLGSGGSGCPNPSLSFTVNGSSAASVEVATGTAVTLDASGSEFKTTEPSELNWSATGPEPFAKSVLGPSPAKTLSHTFSQPGTYKVSLGMQLTPTTFGASWSAPPKTVVVTGAVAAAPTVTAVTPNHGPAAGGTSVRITGTELTGATAVRFGAASATAVHVVSATELTATSPAGAAGTRVDVKVTTPVGTSATSAGDGFTYDAAAGGGGSGDSGGGSGGGGSPPSTSPAPSPAPIPAPKPKPKPKPLVCRKGFKKTRAHGKVKCVKVKKHKSHTRKH